MDRVQPGYVQLILHNDKNTPQDFVIGLLRSVFSLSPADAFEVMVTVEKERQSGVRDLSARGRRGAVSDRSRANPKSGHQLLVTAQAGDDVGQQSLQTVRRFCRRTRFVWSARRPDLRRLYAGLRRISARSRKPSSSASPARPWSGISPACLMTGWSRPRDNFRDICVPTFKRRSTSCSPPPIRFFGIQERHRYETLTFAALTSLARPRMPSRRRNTMMSNRRDRTGQVPRQRLVAVYRRRMRYAVLLSAHREYGAGNRRSYRNRRARGRERRGVREALLLRARERRERRELLSRQGALVRCRRELSRKLEGTDGPQAAAGRTRERDPARSHTETARPQYPELRAKSRAAAPARAVDPQGHPALRSARHRQDPYHPLSGQQLARPHDADHHGGASRAARRLHEPRPPAAAGDGGHRGR